MTATSDVFQKSSLSGYEYNAGKEENGQEGNEKKLLICIRVQPQQHSASYSEYHSWTITRPETYLSLGERTSDYYRCGWLDRHKDTGKNPAKIGNLTVSAAAVTNYQPIGTLCIVE